MKSTHSSGQHTKLSKLSQRLMLECFAAVIAYSAVVFSLLWLAWRFCDSVIWYWENPVYRLLKFIESNIILFIIPILLGGWFPITYHFLSKLLQHLDAVTQAAQALASPSESPIVLSDELSSVENELNRAREKALHNAQAAKEAEQRKNDLVVYLAHDLKTPLTSVIGYLTLLHDEQQISEQLRQKYLSIALEKAERLEDLINEFFEITRFNLSEITLEYSQVNLTRLLEQLTFEFKPMFLEKNLNCTLEVSPNTMVHCDVNQMQRVFDNLLRNAVNYSFAGSTIFIRVFQVDTSLHIQFKNSGNTIPPEKLDRIFEQFYRLDRSRSTQSGGTGLGLAIAKEIVQHHHGAITARSAAEEIEFEVILPCL